MNTLLEKIGLTANESAVYLAFFKLKERTAAEIARTLHMDKSSCYRAVEELVKKGLLVTNPKKRGTTHSAVSPEVLKELMQTKKQELIIQEDFLNSYVEKLISENNTERKTYIKIEKGIEAVRNAMDRELEEASNTDKIMRERYRIENNPAFMSVEHIEWIKDYANRRVKAGVHIKQLFNPEKIDIVPSLMHNSKKLLKELRIMPKEVQATSGFRLAGDITCIISFDKNNDFIVVTFFDRFITELIKSMFDFIWIRSETAGSKKED